MAAEGVHDARTGPLEALTTPLDALRRGLWRLGARTTLGRRCLQDRGLRLEVLGLGHLAASLALTLLAPVWLLLLGPLLLGVPHVASDLRFLVAHAPVAPAVRLAFLVPLAAMVVQRFVSFAGGPFSAALEVGLGLGAAALLLALAPLPRPRRALGIATALGLVALLAPHGHLTLLIFAHLHNAIAATAWFVLASRATSGGLRRMAPVAAAWIGLSACFLLGVFDGMIFAPQAPVSGFTLDGLARTLAPGLEGPWPLRLAGLFAFAQSFHYAIWLRLVPQALDPRPAPPTFARTLDRVRADLGRWGLGLLVAATLALPLAALLRDAGEARHVYLLAAVFHGWLELGVFLAMGLGLRGFGPQGTREAPSGLAARAATP